MSNYPRGVQVPKLTNNPADDTYAWSAGTGIKIAVGGASPPATFGALTGAGSADASSYFAVPKPPGVTNGAVLLIMVQSTNIGAMDTPAGWTALDNLGSGAEFCYVFTKIAANEPLWWLLHGSAASGGIVWSTSWWTSAGGIDKHGIANGTSSPTVTTDVNGCQIVTLATGDSAHSDLLTVDAACTIVSESAHLGSAVVAYDTANQAAAGVTTARTITPAVAPHAYIETIALKP